ncbi:ribosome maturation factor RimM [Notoacmeibacter sp. MSK16QG-6]|uniref:ribosome maturation factor RimM n=1 Tax=Notoacmeibacter sp. MSK16QG-6 TaxID=2957982 RepID=UPI00209FC5FC|nr:ribosome maturation factor RimM [Notoacmeibacter sp. MSK16QG-6]MCP1199209.1 ribosome maturation factor RimM [Notoacmeibacter sp. MSK16QG-6]
MKKSDENRVVVARIGAAHGIRGEVRIKSFTENPADFAAYGPLATDNGRTFEVLSARPQKTMMIARLKNVTTREAAEALNGVELSVSRDALGEADEDEFFLADLIGLTAKSESGEKLGTVAAVHNFGAGDILEIRMVGSGSEMVDFSKHTVPAIDLDEGILTLVLPDQVSERDEADDDDRTEAQ